MRMPYEVFAPEQLTANSVDLLCAGWMVLDLANLWETQWFWDNRVAPGSSGSLPFNAEEDELRVSLPFVVTGWCDGDGNPYDDMQTGFWRNWQYLSENVWYGYPVSCTYQPPDPTEDPIGFQAQFSTPKITERHPVDWKGTMQVILPGGAVRSAGS